MLEIAETTRIILRWFTLDDAAFIQELVNEPAWKRFIGDRGIHSPEAARTYLETGPIASYQQHGFGLFAIELKEDGSLIGTCGLLKRDALDDVDLGFALLARFEGQGLAFEAATAALAHARDTIGLNRVLAITSLDNERSARLLERLGMRFERLVHLTEASPQLRLYVLMLRQMDHVTDQ
jgi:RimJ/RimL family protein N-acetyltransferase